MKNNRYTNWFFAAAVVVAGFSMAACEDEPDKYEVAGGKPTLKYVRVPDPAAADSLLTGGPDSPLPAAFPWPGHILSPPHPRPPSADESR